MPIFDGLSFSCPHGRIGWLTPAWPPDRARHKARRPLGLAGFARKGGRWLKARPEQLLDNQHALRRPGGYGGVAAPVPIPNTAVKRPSADGTSSQDAGE